uniref:Microtubule associated protein 4 n=1 Tax=Pongo abelii TaxID=9601 RepID=A0A8I5TV42_PONAB
MADLSLADALTEPSPDIEGEIKRDFIATLEAEAFDDVVGETVGKTDYIPLLDVDEKTGNSESKKKPCSETSQIEDTPSSKPTLLANGGHGIEGSDTTGNPCSCLSYEWRSLGMTFRCVHSHFMIDIYLFFYFHLVMLIFSHNEMLYCHSGHIQVIQYLNGEAARLVRAALLKCDDFHMPSFSFSLSFFFLFWPNVEDVELCF